MMYKTSRIKQFFTIFCAISHKNRIIKHQKQFSCFIYMSYIKVKVQNLNKSIKENNKICKVSYYLSDQNRFHQTDLTNTLLNLNTENTYPLLLNFTVEQTDVYSWVEIFSTDNGKTFQFKIQSLKGPKQIKLITQNKRFNFLL